MWLPMSAIYYLPAALSVTPNPAWIVLLFLAHLKNERLKGEKGKIQSLPSRVCVNPRNYFHSEFNLPFHSSNLPR